MHRALWHLFDEHKLKDTGHTVSGKAACSCTIIADAVQNHGDLEPKICELKGCGHG